MNNAYIPPDTTIEFFAINDNLTLVLLVAIFTYLIVEILHLIFHYLQGREKNNG